MKQYTIGVFEDRSDAEKAVDRLHHDLSISTDEISFLYRNTEGEVKEVDSDDVTHKTSGEGAVKGAKIGGGVGAALGIATVAGVIPIVGPIFAAGPLVAALGLGAGALGTTAAGAVTGAVAGGIIGALVPLGVSEERAKEYEDRVMAGHVLVAVHADEDKNVSNVLEECGATGLETFRIA